MQKFKNVYVTGTGHFLPGTKINNEEMDQYIGSVNRQSSRIKKMILTENGIKTRHYAINPEGDSKYSVAEMGAQASRVALADAGIELSDLDMIASGTTGGDVVAPGFSNMLQGELKAPPLETMSVSGICCSGMSALKSAAQTVDSGEHQHALVNATEFPSRLFKKTRFDNFEEGVDFNSHFLRWMLSDGAGSFVLSNKPKQNGLSFRLKWMHNRSFSGDFPTCMAVGFGKENAGKGYLDYPSLTEAEKHGGFHLRQDIRLLPNLFEVGFSEYLKLVKEDHIHPGKIDHFLCHYSSEKFSGTIKDLMMKSDVFIPEDKWYSNLSVSGNTGAASIFIMLSEFLKEKEVKPGEQILFFVPESGRFSVSYALLEVCESESAEAVLEGDDMAPPMPDRLKSDYPEMFLELSQVWAEYRSNALRTPLAQKVFSRELTKQEYCKWMSLWIPQVRVGSVWMRNALANLPDELKNLQGLIETHASEEQFDFNILYKDYKNMGGTMELDDMKRTPSGDALNQFMMSMGESNPMALLGGIFIIEGTGQKIIPTLLPFLKDTFGTELKVYKFLEYHGENDQNHLMRWANAVDLALAYSPNMASEIVECAKKVAMLYSMQWTDISQSLERE
ncbi:MAG: 3-oxoacyl-ACP synthase [Bdellovibrionales bacterium]|nr:3-oxoacyl-ACP synthase [Bdellovibrionales bacterium]